MNPLSPFARRAFSTSLRRLNTPQVASTSRLPKLTLYTGGAECSLCDVAKDDLAVIRYSHPFDLEYYNIYKPPEGVEKEEAKRIRELYKYDIPVLYLDSHYLQKHRINSTVLKQILSSYDPSDPHPRYSENKFRANSEAKAWDGVSGRREKKRLMRVGKERERERERLENGGEGKKRGRREDRERDDEAGMGDLDDGGAAETKTGQGER